MVEFRPGLLPARPEKPRLSFSQFLTGAPITPPKSVDWGAAVDEWPMLANDQWGDCVFASEAHALQAWTANASTQVTATAAETLQAYSEVTGFNPDAGPPGQNPTDRGAVMQDALSYWRKTGMPACGARHRIVAFADVNHRDPTELEAAVALFGEVLLGIQVTQDAMTRFASGQPWDAAPTSRVLGGHAICAGTYDDQARYRWRVVTWGRVQECTQAFLDAHLLEAWVVVSPEWVAANGVAPSGLDLAGLGSAFQALTGDPNPFGPEPAPPAPPPVPAPDMGALLAVVKQTASDPRVQRWLALRHRGLSRVVERQLREVIDAAR